MSNSKENLLNDKNGDEPKVKKLKLDEEAFNCSDSIHGSKIDLSNFEIKRVLQNNCLRKCICVEGSFKDHKSPAIVLLEKKVFPTDHESLKKTFFNEKMNFEEQLINNIYGNYDCFPDPEHNGLSGIIIHPATEKHIEKYKTKVLYMINETADLYEKVTLPYILSSSFSIEWVDNILEHKAEAEKIIFEDPDKETGFIMLPDLKWNGEKSNLMVLALPFQRIRSIRELNASHLPLLKNIRDSGIATISKKFDIHPSQLRIYFHYRPSYYHLHVHFSYLMFEAPGTHVERAHLLSTVISNLELMSDYYAKATLSYVVFEGEELCKKFQELGLVDETTEDAET